MIGRSLVGLGPIDEVDLLAYPTILFGPGMFGGVDLLVRDRSQVPSWRLGRSR